MGADLGHGRTLDPAWGVVAIADHEMPPLPDDLLQNPAAARVDPRMWFDKPDRPLEIEIGPGKGTFLIEQAPNQPEHDFLGIEWAGEFFAYAADRVRRRRAAGQLTNVRLLRADATEFLRWRCPDAVVRVLHLYFSDPWPKKKHHKKRVIQDCFMAEAWRVLEPGGELRVVTDHPGLWAWNETHFANWTAKAHDSPARAAGGFPPVPFERLEFTTPLSAGEGELVGSNYERKWRQEGRDFFAATLRKLDGP